METTVLTYLTDGQRHLICYPYSKDNLHRMASDLNIKKHWMHKNHYDIPKSRIDEITEKCTMITTKELIKIINGSTLEELNIRV